MAPTALTVTEQWQPNQRAVRWTARRGRSVVASVLVPMEYGMFDSSALRQAVADALHIAENTISHERKRSDAHRIVPRLMHVG